MACGNSNTRFYVMCILFTLLLIQYILEFHVRTPNSPVTDRGRSGEASSLRVSLAKTVDEERANDNNKSVTHDRDAQGDCLNSNVSVINNVVNDTGVDWERILRMRSTGFHSFNATASDLIGRHREDLEDTRYEECKNITYDICNLPVTSVIIIFHNEAWSTLLRSVHSILERTPPSLILEIILVDDCSTFKWLKDPLTDYVKHLNKVTLIRLKTRQGLIKARLRGAREAKGEVLYFADSHTEANVGWLEPLLTRIVQNRKVVAVPYADPINWKNMKYTRVAADYHGAFNWNMEYFYKIVPQEVLNGRKSITDPIPSPTMIGCAHAVDKNYFFESGSYDESMEIWGGENIEHSFRLWMCGGRVEVMPCSKIGHVFKPQLPYSFGENSEKVIQRNMIRLAEVWMDDYKKYYYATQDRLAPIDVHAMFQRKKLREKLNCKSFHWYMTTVIPEMPIPPQGAKWFGKINWLNNFEYCIVNDPMDQTLRVVPCEPQVWKTVTFTITKTGQFMWNDQCIGVRDNTSLVLQTNVECSSLSSVWEYNAESNLIYLSDAALCLEADVTAKSISLVACAREKLIQQWKFEMHFDFDKPHNVLRNTMEHLSIPINALRFGQLASVKEHFCLHVLDHLQFEMIPCEEQPSYLHVVHLDDDKRLVYEDTCVTVSHDNTLTLSKCNQLDKSQELWDYHSETLHFTATTANSSLCLTFNQNVGNNMYLADCDNTDLYQAWTL